MFKSFFVGLWDRVVVNYKPTLIGLGLGILAFVVEYAAQQFAGLPAGWAKIVAPIFVAVGAWLKDKAKQYPQAVPPASP